MKRFVWIGKECFLLRKTKNGTLVHWKISQNKEMASYFLYDEKKILLEDVSRFWFLFFIKKL